MNHQNKSKRFFPAAFLFSLIFLIQGCYYDKEELLYPGPPTDCTTVPAKFSANVAPLVSSKCATSGCHNATTAAGGYVLQNYAQISAAKDRIKITAVVQRSMPKSGSLTTAEINILKCWIESGAPNN